MKLNIDLGYILKRVFVIVLAFVIIQSIKGCEVFAAPLTFQSGITTCYTYNSYDSTTPNINCFSNVSESSSGGVSRYKIPNFRYNRLRLDITVPSNVPTGYYTMYFNTITRPNDSPIMHVNSGGHIFNCISETEMHNYYGAASDGSNASTIVGQPENYICNNVYLTSNTSIQLHFSGQNSYSSDSSNTVFYIAKRFTVNPVENISSVIESQSQQQHQDSENTQNAINGVDNSLNDSSIDSNTQNANGIFDTDENGQPTNPIFNSYGIESIITGPLRILQRSTESCSPVSFTIFSKQITLPCGDTLFWNRDFSSQQSIFTSGVSGSGLNSTRNTFRDLWNLLFGGAIIFHLLLKLYDVIQKAVDPMSDEYQNINSAIDTSGLKAVRDSDGDFDTSSMDKLRNTAILAKGVYDDDSFHVMKGRRV